MKHAGPKALDRLEPLLKKLRGQAGLKEKAHGSFYRAHRAFIHFHEHGADELHADIRLTGEDFDRYPVTTQAQRKTILKLVGRALADGKSIGGR